MFRMPNFGRKSLNEIKEVLAQLDLHFMEVPGWPPENVEELANSSFRARFLAQEINAICESLDIRGPLPLWILIAKATRSLTMKIKK